MPSGLPTRASAPLPSTQSATTPSAASAERAIRRIAGRYDLRALLGRGGHGEVWEAEDSLTQMLVAVKLLGDGASLEPARVRREVSALRLLRIPGVVQLLDEGIDAGKPFLVMERIAGAPFPGSDRKEWSHISAATVALLETLSRVHAAGVVHRDLKPGNVLVDDLGRPTILDFGLSFGPSLGQGLTGDGRILGTPDYLAPEQILGEPVIPATDLYALGIMLYEALSGRLPHEADDFQTLMRMRLTETPAPLRDLSPDVPLGVATAVDALLARAPEDRPRSADDLLDQLREGRPFSSAAQSPYLGHQGVLRKLVGAARRRRAMDVVGLPGAGRTRCLQELAAALEAERMEFVWSVPGKRPFASLEHVVGSWQIRPDQALADMTEQMDRQLERTLDAGRVILADDPSTMDRWSLAAIERGRPKGAVIRVVDAVIEEDLVERDDAVVLRSLQEGDLYSLFTGPDRIFHLRQDAAGELFLRTSGLPSRVFSELSAWERAGLAQSMGMQWSVGRDAMDKLAAGRMALPPVPVVHVPPARPLRLAPHLEELAAWIELSWPHTRLPDLSRITDQPIWRLEAETEELLECGAIARLPDGRMVPLGAKGVASRRRTERRKSAHRAIAKALPPGAEGRLFHLIAGQSERDAADPAEIATETLALVEPLLLEGHLGQATALLADGLLAARRGAAMCEAEWGESRLLGLWVQIALSEGTPRALDRVLYELCRASKRTDEVQAQELLVRAALAMRTTAGDRALSLVDDIAPFADPNLERRRQHVRVQSARLCSMEREEAVLAEVERWARETGDTQAETSFADWLGRLRYRQGRFDEAAALHAKAAASERWITERIGALLNGASALLEAFRFDEAVVTAADARALAEQCRHSYYEARAEWLMRSAKYRRGDCMGVDEELVELAAKAGVIDLEALVCLNEAALAWRSSDGDLAATLARRTERIWTSMGKTWGARFAHALVLAATGAAPEEALALAREAEQCPVPGAGIQMLGLLARACPKVARQLETALHSLRGAIPEWCWSLRMDVLSVEEAFAAIGAAR